MRRMMIVFSVVAVAVLAAGAVQADPRTDYYMANYQAGLAYFPFENIENGNFDYLSPFDSPRPPAKARCGSRPARRQRPRT